MAARAEYSKIFPAAPRTERGFPVVLGHDPKNINFLYCHGNSVYIRDVNNATQCDIYTEHQTQVNVAKYQPSGFYIASGDENGKLRIWDTTQKEHILKNEFVPTGGSIKDASWSPDNQRIVTCGDGKESFGSVFLSDTGTTTGSIIGHSKVINSCDFKPTRPFRIITASEDFTANLHEGPPFKFKHSIKEHSNFVQSARFSPSGDIFVTASADKRILAFDAKEGDLKGEFKDGEGPAHGGSIYAVSFSKDGSQLLSVSADKCAKIWDVESKALVQKFVLGNAIEDMQVGCLWQGDNLITVSLRGDITYLDKNNPETPLKVVRGHNKKITCMTLLGDKLHSADYMGNVLEWNVATGMAERVAGNASNQIFKIATCGSEQVVFISVDDYVHFIDVPTRSVLDVNIKCPSQPRAIAALSNGSTLLVGCLNQILVVQQQNVVATFETADELVDVAIDNASGNRVACALKNKVLFYELNGTSFDLKHEMSLTNGPLRVSYSPDGNWIAVVDSARVIRVISSSDFSKKNDLCYHSAKIVAISWHSDSQHLVSGGLDTNIICWNINDANTFGKLMQAHPKSSITELIYLDDQNIISCGFDDCNIKFWQVPK